MDILGITAAVGINKDINMQISPIPLSYIQFEYFISVKLAVS